MLDNNCDGTTDPGCICTNGMTQMCGAPDGMGGYLSRGICRPGMQTCSGGAWGLCVGSVVPTAETCNSADDDCDGTVDESSMIPYYRDCDRDGYGAMGSVGVTGCMAPSTPPTCSGSTGVWVPNADDCNDGNMAIFPNAVEICDSGTIVDQNCNGNADEGRIDCIKDEDSDGWHYVDSRGRVTRGNVCSSPPGMCPPGWVLESVSRGADCNDTSALAFPGAVENRCNGINEDCDRDNLVDEGLTVLRHYDEDRDGYGSTLHTYMGCPNVYEPPMLGDCNDYDAEVYPGQTRYFLNEAGICSVPGGSSCRAQTFPGYVLGCRTSNGGACVRDTGFARSGDYDCDGVETPEPSVSVPCMCVAGGSPSCQPPPTGIPNGFTYFYTGTRSCGQMTPLLSCTDNGPPLCSQGGSCTPGASSTLQPLSCR